MGEGAHCKCEDAFTTHVVLLAPAMRSAYCSCTGSAAQLKSPLARAAKLICWKLAKQMPSPCKCWPTPYSATT